VNPTRVESLEVNETDDGLVVYDAASGMVHHLNSSAAVIFDLCDGTRDPEKIAVVLAEAFALEQPPREEALAGLRDLADRGLVRWDGR
jgi:PqqD family protein of HPr-rel-A system